MPAGDDVPQGNLLAVISKPDGVQWKVNWNNGGTSAGSLMPLNAGQSHQRNKPGSGDRANEGHRKGNNCSNCPALSCRSNDFAEKSAKCISRHTSTFDISKLSAGKQMVIKVLREYDKAHPDATSLKQVDLKVTKASKEAAAGNANGGGGGGRPAEQSTGGARQGVVKSLLSSTTATS